MNAQWLSIVLGRHFKVQVLLGIYLICLYNLKSIVEFKFCAKKPYLVAMAQKIAKTV